MSVDEDLAMSWDGRIEVFMLFHPLLARPCRSSCVPYAEPQPAICTY